MADRTPVIVAAIGLVGTITVGLLTNADKLRGLFGRPPAAVPTQSFPLVTNNGQSTAAPPAGVADGDQPDVSADGKRGTAKSLTGTWASDDGYSFRFHQSGNVFSYAASEKGAERGTGDGTINGRRLTYGFTSPDGSGVCEATVSIEGNDIAGRCHMGDSPQQSWAMSIRRVS